MWRWTGLWVMGLALMGAPSAWAARTDGMALRATFSGAIARAMPGVVNIFAGHKGMNGVGASPALSNVVEGQLKQRLEKSLGSGVILDSAGTVVTNLHVVQGASDVQVVLSDGQTLPVTFLGADEKLDLAVLRLKLSSNVKLKPVPFGDSDSLQVGDVVMAIGNPYGLGQSASMGIVSAVDRTNPELSQYSQYIQTDATINPGNSGGALIDSNGLLVGVNTAIYTRNGASQGIGFAIPAALVKQVVADIVRTGKVARPWFGAMGVTVTPDMAAKVGLPDTHGVWIAEVEAGSPAAKAGLVAGDVLRSLQGRVLADPAALGEQIVRLQVGSGPVPMVVWRGGKEVVLSIVPASADSKPVVLPRVLGGHSLLAGLVLEDRGVGKLFVVKNGGNAGQMFPQIARGDRLLEVNGVAVTTVEALEAQLEVPSRTWQVKVVRGGKVLLLQQAR